MAGLMVAGGFSSASEILSMTNWLLIAMANPKQSRETANDQVRFDSHMFFSDQINSLG